MNQLFNLLRLKWTERRRKHNLKNAPIFNFSRFLVDSLGQFRQEKAIFHWNDGCLGGCALSTYTIVIEFLLNSCGRMNQPFLCENSTLFCSRFHTKTTTTPVRFSQMYGWIYFFFQYFSSILFMWMQHVSLPLLKKVNRKSSQSQPENTPTMCSVVSIIFDASNTFLNCFLWQSKLKTIRSLNSQKKWIEKKKTKQKSEEKKIKSEMYFHPENKKEQKIKCFFSVDIWCVEKKFDTFYLEKESAVKCDTCTARNNFWFWLVVSFSMWTGVLWVSIRWKRRNETHLYDGDCRAYAHITVAKSNDIYCCSVFFSAFFRRVQPQTAIQWKRKKNKLTRTHANKRCWTVRRWQKRDK